MRNIKCLQILFISLILIIVSVHGFAAADFKVYGAIKLSVNSVDDGDESSTSVSNNSTRFGMKGSKKLTPGLKAIYKLELGVDAAQRSTALEGRNSFVGIKSKLGQVFVGQHDTPFKKVRSHGTVIFGDTIADSRTLISAISDGGGAKIDNRAKNAFAIKTAKIGGHTQFFVMYSVDMDNTGGADDNQKDLQSYSITYSNGPLYIGIGTEIRENGAGTDDTESSRLGLSYKIGSVQLGALYETADKGFENSLTRDAFLISGRYSFSKATWLGLQFSMVDDYASNAVAKTGAYSVALGLMSKLSKTTTVYIVGASTVNDDNASFGLAQSGIDDKVRAIVPGENVVGISVGMVQKF